MLELMKEKISLMTSLAAGKKPIVIYGMGDGAAKIITILKSHNLEPAALFASDDFVRGQSFMGYRVEKLSEIEARLDDFTVLLSFATHLPEVMAHIDEIAQRHPLFIPDVNVAGDYSEIFDEEYLHCHADGLEKSAGLFADEKSRRFFASLCDFKLSGKRCYLNELDEYSSEEDIERKVFCYCDLGAYCGDTLKSAIARYPELHEVIALEPERHSFRKLSAFAGECLDSGRLTRSVCVNAAALDENGSISLGEGEGRGCALADTVFQNGMRKKKLAATAAVTLDSLIEREKIKPDLIKLDVEGCEKQALLGAARTLAADCPDLVVSMYHKNSDLFELPQLIHSLLPEKKLYLRRARKCLPAWEIEIVAK